MAASLDTTASGTNTAVASITVSLTVAANSNRGLVVAVVITATGADRVVSTVTYNAVSCSFIAAVGISTGDNARLEFWKLVAPATGTHDVVVTFDSTVDRGVVGAFSVYDADQTTFNRTTASRTGGTTPETSSSIAPTSAVGDLVVDCIGFRYPGQGTVTVGGGQTQQWSENAITGTGSTEPGSASSTTMSWSWATGGWTSSSQMAVAIMSAASGAKPASYYQMMRSA